MGTPVILSFVNGDRNYPYVVSVLDNYPADLYTGKNFMMPDYLSVATRAPHDPTIGYVGGHPTL